MHPIRALVLDNVDPEGQGRVRIEAPELGDFWTTWAPVATAYGAASSVSPDIGDEVLTIFVGGDEGYPVVIGRLNGS